MGVLQFRWLSRQCGKRWGCLKFLCAQNNHRCPLAWLHLLACLLVLVDLQVRLLVLVDLLGCFLARAHHLQVVLQVWLHLLVDLPQVLVDLRNLL